ncbi:Phosphocarrier protein HPr /phosphoenolpyruvate--protein phosphotransferase /PTS system IIA component, Glc family [Austwickia chelonae]|uniref:Phosphocarrier protein HPr n=1 Tax=Austwickia chelonae NBRC 105200 TaxID=1184607 RepID=K6UNT7_9MICO|nr:phosphoenolpyruvate--protein phosphotransferase [Austwickia chelonae]GAB79241.1 putative phosphoenolpyruvate-protein phosphotransferase [Austwickia chelonae NBRC 105200]SEW37530.1 Phosphocarrier protein HPr /phosphoenolpyruvate--protein phosphotransferase /PTS system IIA component, Glc family [Austwickia chelonae]
MTTAPSSAPGLRLIAPVSGVLVPIEQVPDPVFAQKMVGEGISIDPLSSSLLAPCDGEIAHIHPSQHAVTVRTADGLEILLHIGLDTVQMRGEGFTARVELGDKVTVGQPLIDFDMDKIAVEAKSLLTQVVIANSDRIATFEPVTGIVQAGDDVVATITLAAGDSADGAGAEPTGRTVTSPAVLVPNPAGLHARPAATLATAAKRFESQILLRRGDESANAKSVMAIMAMSVSLRDKVQISATGADADKAAADLSRAIAEGLGEAGVTALPDDPDAAPVSAPATAATSYGEPLIRRRSEDPDVLLGVSASPGLGVGTVVQIRKDEIEVEEFAHDRHAERRALTDALDRAAVQLKSLRDKMAKEADDDKAQIFEAHQALLTDPDLLDIAVSGIDKGKSAPFAWRAAYTVYADRLAGLKNEILAGRANDVRDVGRRVLEELTGHKAEGPVIVEGSILIAEDLTPSDTASLDTSKVVGFATVGGGATSHVAILARSMDIPAIAGIEAKALELANGSRVVLDGAAGTLRINVTDDEVARIRERQARVAERKQRDLAEAHSPAVTTDGRAIEVVANIGSAQDARTAAEVGGEGVGLLRSEFLFLDRSTAPTEDEQYEAYRAAAEALSPGQPLVIRTLDVGGDKPLPYLPLPREENPFLGERGIRVGLNRPDVLRTQLRAILRASTTGAKLHIMFPMVATLEDLRAAKGVLEEERERLGVDPVPVGIMVEVPSTAVMARQFATECDFFSIGTNDLTQYTLAMDRGHPTLAPQVDALNPAVLGLIAQTVEAAHAHGRWVGVCGGVASDPQATAILVGLGVDELSVSVPAIPTVKAQVRALNVERSRELAAQALAADTAADVRALVPYEQY